MHVLAPLLPSAPLLSLAPLLSSAPLLPSAPSFYPLQNLIIKFPLEFNVRAPSLLQLDIICNMFKFYLSLTFVLLYFLLAQIPGVSCTQKIRTSCVKTVNLQSLIRYMLLKGSNATFFVKYLLVF